MNYFLNEETLTQKEDTGKKKTGKDRRKCKQKMGNVFVKRGVMVKAEIPRR